MIKGVRLDKRNNLAMNEQRVICVLRLFGQNANVFVFTHLLCSTCAVVMALCSVLILRGVCRGVCILSCAWPG